MSINKLVFTILASLAVYANAGISTNFTRGKMLGTWYNLAVIIPPWGHVTSKCESFVITPREGSDTKFDEVASSIFAGTSHTMDGQGRVEGSKVFIAFPKYVLGESTYNVMEFNNGNEMILFDPTKYLYCTLASRTTTVSTDALDALKGIATRSGNQVGFIDHNNCK